uniref:Centrosomal protein of 162 kDa n=1 Tax=Macrostomum lignano TaxID=282301 RepID=A0A1I8FFW4_9PLAT
GLRWIRAFEAAVARRGRSSRNCRRLRKELAAKTAQLERLRNRHGDELASAATQLKRRFLDLQSTAERESRSPETALAERRCDRGRIETELSHLREQKRRSDADRRIVGGATYQTPAAAAMQNRRLPPWPKLKSAGQKLRMRKRCCRASCTLSGVFG